MSLKDILIMEVPSVAMKDILKLHKVKSQGISVEQYADALLSDNKTAIIAPALADEFKFAGKTVVNLCLPTTGIDKFLMNKDDLKRKLIEIHGNDIFKNRKRTALSLEPVPIRAYDLDSKIYIEYSYQGNEQRFIENFELKKRRPQLINYVIVHFNPFMIEVRSSAEERTKFLAAFIETLGLDQTNVQWIYDSILGETEINLLADKLSASLKGAKHKMTNGIYDTVEVKANTQVSDLSQEKQYQNQFKGIPAETRNFRFIHYHSLGFQQNVSLTITRKGGLWFRTTIGEEVISCVVNAISEIRKQLKIQNHSLVIQSDESTSSSKKTVNL